MKKKEKTFKLNFNMKKIKYNLFSFSLLIMIGISFVFPINTKAEELPNSTVTPPITNYIAYQDYNYIITGYDINIDVNENNTLDITENIHAYFNKARHGLYRTIPLTNTVRRLDGTTTKNRAQISNLKVSDSYTTTKQFGTYKIQIGDPNKTIVGDKDYVISYTYNLGKDPIKDYDELYFNLIGNEWDTNITIVNFTINLPKGFDSDNLGFSTGKFGSTSSSDVYYQVNGNTISGYTLKMLEPGEGLTIRLELEEGYFKNAKLQVDWKESLIYIFPILFTFFGYNLWKKYGKDNKVVKTIEFNPPDGMNSLDVGFYYKGIATDKDVISLLLYFANKGYLKISKTQVPKLFGTRESFTIRKLKEYDGNDWCEKTFLEGLFRKRRKDQSPYLIGIQTIPSNKVTEEDLKDNFYITISHILNDKKSKESQDKIFDSKSVRKKGSIMAAIVITFLIIIIPPFLTTYDFIGVFLPLFFAVLAISIYTYYTVKDLEEKTKKLPSILLMVLVIIIVLCISFFAFPNVLLAFDSITLTGYLIGLICIIIMTIFYRIIPKRTPYGIEILGKIKGFKEFIETTEKDKLETLVQDNPTYYYDILPYAYVLGVSNTWMKKFESMSYQPPNWYEGSTDFHISDFDHFMCSATRSMTSALSSSMSSGSGGSSGSSGGGSSGGGSGGGGGGSW